MRFAATSAVLAPPVSMFAVCTEAAAACPAASCYCYSRASARPIAFNADTVRIETSSTGCAGNRSPVVRVVEMQARAARHAIAKERRNIYAARHASERGRLLRYDPLLLKPPPQGDAAGL